MKSLRILVFIALIIETGMEDILADFEFCILFFDFDELKVQEI